MDRVQVLKQESSDLGGDNADAVEYPTPIEPQEDALEAAGLYLQDATNRDEAVQVWRNGDDMMFVDPRVGVPYSLEQLISSPSVPLDFAQASSEGVSTSTSTTFVAKATLVLTNIEAGTYYTVFYIEATTSAANKDYELQLTVDTVSWADSRDRVTIAGQYRPFGGFVLVDLAAGNHTVVLQFRILAANPQPSVSVRRGRIGFWRAA